MGDSCRFFTGSQDICGKILSICTTDQKSEDFGKINVAWYYFKNELDYKQLGMNDMEQAAVAD